jgi:hypothetical protein
MTTAMGLLWPHPLVLSHRSMWYKHILTHQGKDGLHRPGPETYSHGPPYGTKAM